MTHPAQGPQNGSGSGSPTLNATAPPKPAAPPLTPAEQAMTFAVAFITARARQGLVDIGELIDAANQIKSFITP